MEIKIQIIRNPVSIRAIESIAESQFGDMVKAVVDVKNEIVAIAGELHADEEAELLAQGSSQKDLWGINLYVGKRVDEWIEFDSLINIRPSQGNKSRNVEDAELRARIIAIVSKLIQR